MKIYVIVIIVETIFMKSKQSYPTSFIDTP